MTKKRGESNKAPRVEPSQHNAAIRPTKNRKRKPLDVAPTVSTHEPLAEIEAAARQWYHIKKVFIHDGKDGVADTLVERLVEPDPSSASMGATAIISHISAQLDSWESSQDGRSSGGRTTGKLRKEESEQDYRAIRRMADSLLASGEAPRYIAGIISKEKTEFSLPKVMRALAHHPSGHWSGKRTRRD